MKRQRIDINYKIKMLSPFHFNNGNTSGLGQRLTTKDNNGNLIIPGSTLKGSARNMVWQLCREWGIMVCKSQYGEGNCFKKPCLICRLFGRRGLASNLYFQNGYLAQEFQEIFSFADHSISYGQTQNRSQIRLSRERGVAKEGHLFNSEYGEADLVFEAGINGRMAITDARKSNFYPELELLIAGLTMLEQIGSGKSQGFGRIAVDFATIAVTINEKNYQPQQLLDIRQAIEILRKEVCEDEDYYFS